MKKRNLRSRKDMGLGKYDAPLIIQYTRGINDFKSGNLANPFHLNTMQYREWERGFTRAYYDRLKKVKQHEAKERSRRLDQEEVQQHENR